MGQYSVNVYYHWESGIHAEPLAIDPDSEEPGVELIQLCAPHGIKVVEFVVSQTGVKPQLPSSEPLDGEVLIERRVSPVALSPINEKGEAIYSVTGTYIFQLLRPPTPEQGYSVGLAPPYKGSVRVIYGLPDFIKGII